jgi:hypothetical protein
MTEFTDFKARCQAFRIQNKNPRIGCLATGKYSTWECCEYHLSLFREDEAITQEAINLTQKVFPEAKQDDQVPSMFWIDTELMSVLSEHWWQLMQFRVQQ